MLTVLPPAAYVYPSDVPADRAASHYGCRSTGLPDELMVESNDLDRQIAHLRSRIADADRQIADTHDRTHCRCCGFETVGTDLCTPRNSGER